MGNSLSQPTSNQEPSAAPSPAPAPAFVPASTPTLTPTPTTESTSPSTPPHTDAAAKPDVIKSDAQRVSPETGEAYPVQPAATGKDAAPAPAPTPGGVKGGSGAGWGLWGSGGSKEPLPNPGAYDEINQEATLVLRPNLIDGLSFNFNAPLSESFMMGSSVEMGGKANSGHFAFNANYITNRLVLLSRTSPAAGRVNGRVFMNVTPAMTAKVVADVGAEPDSSRLSCDLDYRGLSSCSQVKVASGRIVALNHIRSISPRLAIGGELLVQARTGFTATTLALRHADASRIASLSVGNFGPLIASYVRKVNPKVSFAAELFVDARTKESHLTVGYKFDLTSATIAGHVDTSGRVAAMLEERINPALSLTLSGELDHVKDNHNFGFGINIGSG